MEYMKLMIRKIQEKDLPTEDEKWLAELDFANENSKVSAKIVLEYPVHTELNAEIVKHLQQLWNDKTIRMLFNDWRAKICVADSTGYYLNDLSRITADDYVPTDEDLLLVRYRTTGMTEKKINN